MKASEVYLRAAQLIDRRGGYSCEAVIEAAGAPHDTPESETYASLFKPTGFEHSWEPWAQGWGNRIDRRNCRVLALLFMAAIAESEE